ncbi:MAG TPA: hypothetical protein VMD59_08815 [Acidimicrobiales bacterium]|nr:hypothetical protein [Acidimicrobiales bacterium]
MGGLSIEPKVVHVGQDITATTGADPGQDTWSWHLFVGEVGGGKAVSGCGADEASCTVKASSRATSGTWELFGEGIVIPFLGGTGTSSSSDYFIINDDLYGVSGIVTGITGKGIDGATVDISGAGSAVTASNGSYVKLVHRGTYVVSVDKKSVVATVCQPGSRASPSACRLPVSTGGAEADFTTKGGLVVNSTLTDDDPPDSLSEGVCDTTPTGPDQTCTLPAAVELARAGVGDDITFDIPGGSVPQILFPPWKGGEEADPAGGEIALPPGPIVVDGESQPGTHRVEVTDRGLTCTTACTVDGLVLNSEPDSASQWMLNLGDGGTARGDCIDTDTTCTGSYVGPTTEAVRKAHGAAYGIIGGTGDTIGGDAAGDGNVVLSMSPPPSSEPGVYEDSRTVICGDDCKVLGNDIGAFPGASAPLAATEEGTSGEYPLSLAVGSGSLVGGSTPDAGNLVANGVKADVILKEGQAPVWGPGNVVVQGNTIFPTLVVGGNHDVVGGDAAKTGSPPGNTIIGAGVEVDGNNDLVQGNTISGGPGVGKIDDTGVVLFGDEDTVGGLGSRLGNDISGFGTSTDPGDGVVVADSGFHHDLIASNIIDDDGGYGGVVVLQGSGVEVYANSMSDDTPLGISLPSDSHEWHFDVYEPLTGLPISIPVPPWPSNQNMEPPRLDSVDPGPAGRLIVHGTLDAFPRLGGNYQLDVYDDPSCDPPEGQSFVGRYLVKLPATGTGSFVINVPIPAGNQQLTWTATSPDGSTSEFGSCFRNLTPTTTTTAR